MHRAAIAVLAAAGPALLTLLAACSGPPPAQVDDELLAPAPWEQDWAPAERDTWREGVVVQMAPGTDGRGHEVGPMEGATVELRVPSPDGKAYSKEPIATATTGADGRFRVGPAPASSWVLRVTKPGFASPWIGDGTAAALLGAAPPIPGEELRPALRPAHTIAGSVLDEAGRPVAGVRVVASSVAYREDLVSDDGGRFVAHAPFGLVVLEVDDPRFESKPSPTTIPAFGAGPSVVLVARPSAPVRGWVQSQEGKRIAGAVVLCVEDPSIRTRTGSDGRFEMSIRRPNHVAAIAPGWSWRSCALPRAGEVELRLEPVPGVAGVVVDAAGRPVPDARLTAVVLNFEGLFERVRGPRTRADGRFDFSWLPRAPRGIEYPVRIVARRRGSGESAIVSPPAEGREDLRLVLTGERTLEGRALRADGRPIAGAVVTAKWGHWDGGVTPHEVAALGFDESTAVTTDAEGRWRLVGVPLLLHAKVQCAALGVAREQFVDQIPETGPLDFVFDEGQALAGRVTGTDGRPAEGKVVVKAQLLNAEGLEVNRVVEAAADGSFRFENLPSGSYQITVEGASYDLPAGAVIDAGQTSAQLTLQRSAKLTVKLVFEGGVVPGNPLSLQLLPAGGGSQQFREPIPAGRAGEPFVLRGIYPGKWSLGVSGDVWRGSKDGLDLGDGADVQVELPVARTLRVAAKLTDTDGRPVRRQLVVVSPVANPRAAPQTAVSDDEGVLDLTGLSPGRWTFTAEPPGAASIATEFEVRDGDNARLDLRVPPHGTLVVRVARDNGDPIPGAIVVLRTPGGDALDAWGEDKQGRRNRFHTNAEGRTTILGVRAGAVHVEVRVDAAAGSTVLKAVDVDVASGKFTTVDVP